jgi:hypothetical protein
MSLQSHLNFLKYHYNLILFDCCDMFQPCKAILRLLLIGWNYRTVAWPTKSVIIIMNPLVAEIYDVKTLDLGSQQDNLCSLIMQYLS